MEAVFSRLCLRYAGEFPSVRIGDLHYFSIVHTDPIHEPVSP